MGPAHARLHGVDARTGLRDHPLRQDAVVDERDEPIHVDPRDQRRLVGEIAVHPGHVGEVDELLGAERLGDRARDRVGVHVVRLAGLVDTDRRHDRDQLLAEEPLEDRRVDPTDVPDEAELVVPLADGDESGVLS